jgi:hypothetical protein
LPVCVCATRGVLLVPGRLVWLVLFANKKFELVASKVWGSSGGLLPV